MSPSGSKSLLRASTTLGTASTRSLGSLGEETVPRSRPANTREEREAQLDNNERAKQYQRSMRVEHIEKSLALARPAAQPPVSDEFVLRWASEEFAKAIDFAFADSRTFSCARTAHPDQHASPGDEVLSPVAIFEIRDPSAAAAYGAQKAKLLSGPRMAPLPSPPLTTGVFDDAIDQNGPAGTLRSGEPVNEALVYHGLPANDALEVLYTGLYEHSPNARTKPYGPGMYFSDTCAHADRYAGEARGAKMRGQPGAVLAGHLRLSEGETHTTRFMLVCRVLLGHAATADAPLAPPYDTHRSTTGEAGPIYAPRSNGKRWAPPYSSLVGAEQNPAGGTNQVFVMKAGQAARCLPVALIAYRHVTTRWEELVNRQIYG